jgi:hypothetical protein
MRPQLAPGKSLGNPPKVHYGNSFALCGRISKTPMLICDRWSVVDCKNCIRTQHARHDKPCR